MVANRAGSRRDGPAVVFTTSRPSHRSGPRRRPTLPLLIILSVALLTIDARGVSAIDDIRATTTDGFDQLRSAVDDAARPLSDTIDGALAYDEVVAENERLRAENDEAARNSVAATAALEELEQLAGLAGIASYHGTESITARVVARSPSNLATGIILDMGTSDGIEVGMPVVAPAGLVGRISAAGTSQATVSPITDPTLSVGVRLAGTRDVGVATGTGRGSPLTIDAGIEPDTVVRVGTDVTTSGIEGSLYPPGVPVGEVTAVNRGPAGIRQQVTVEPFADLERMSLVDVLIWDAQ